jgi:hypothetical protein
MTLLLCKIEAAQPMRLQAAMHLQTARALLLVRQSKRLSCSPNAQRAAQVVHVLLLARVEVLLLLAGPAGAGQHLRKLRPAGTTAEAKAD